MEPSFRGLIICQIDPWLLQNRDFTHNPLNECKRLWVLKKGGGERKLVGCEYRSEESFLRGLETKSSRRAVALALG